MSEALTAISIAIFISITVVQISVQGIITQDEDGEIMRGVVKRGQTSA